MTCIQVKQRQNYSKSNKSNLYNKRVRPTKKEPQQQGISYLEIQREGVREGGGGRAGQQAVIFKVKLGLWETEIQRDTET